MILDDRRSLSPDLDSYFIFLFSIFSPAWAWSQPFMDPALPAWLALCCPADIPSFLSLQLPNGQKGTHAPSGTPILLGVFPLLSTSNILCSLCLAFKRRKKRSMCSQAHFDVAICLFFRPLNVEVFDLSV